MYNDEVNLAKLDEVSIAVWVNVIPNWYCLTVDPVGYQVKVIEFNLDYSGLCANGRNGYLQPRRSSYRWQCDAGYPSRTNQCAVCTDAASWVRADYPIPTTGYIRDFQTRACTHTSSSTEVNIKLVKCFSKHKVSGAVPSRIHILEWHWESGLLFWNYEKEIANNGIIIPKVIRF